VVAHYGGDLDRANVHPPARARLHARFAPPVARTAEA
jgi:hypothetical protein